MKKIMFNEHFGLETATLNGSKTRTSRILKLPKSFKGTFVCGFHKYTNKQGEWFTSLYDEDGRDIDESSIPYRYSEGEIVAIAQRYKDIFSMGWKSELTGNEAGWHNKMFVKAEYMPHQIQITNIKLEHLQDISDEDCLKEGIYVTEGTSNFAENFKKYCLHIPTKNGYYELVKKSYKGIADIFSSPRQAYSYLIDKVSGRGTWNKNPWVVVYYYKLIK